MECAASRHVTLCDADSRGFIVVAFCSAILHHWMCKIPTEVATLTISLSIAAWVDKYKRKLNEKISLYQQDWDVIKVGISCSIQKILAAT
ncbi:hypothetical protein Psal006b_03174 [Piscirickettsia salmonis]|uniref:Transposase n=2 Tax=Piscirickettsia salmonis TaxID=1238 RepID=A0AAC9EUF9_PISSA|nr:transposase [Piscirickettsia salmonis]QGO00137.1 hypothetical protein Psal006b_03174 [Piscirickettsia salmonis]QGO03788.1 hypothetical protein Psal008_03205 [Piscirickettsia salmonis]QGO14412.1 hypothetical protein Psal010b_03166 [Piscirickettsia salmonis]QGO21514.1 hypothetical protein Psal013_03210 [Piscirickettsia salmonis]